MARCSTSPTRRTVRWPTPSPTSPTRRLFTESPVHPRGTTRSTRSRWRPCYPAEGGTPPVGGPRARSTSSYPTGDSSPTPCTPTPPSSRRSSAPPTPSGSSSATGRIPTDRTSGRNSHVSCGPRSGRNLTCRSTEPTCLSCPVVLPPSPVGFSLMPRASCSRP